MLASSPPPAASSFWRDRLEQLEQRFSLPFGRDRRARARRTCQRALNDAVARRLLKLVRGEETGLLAVLFAGLSVVLERYTASRTIIVLTPRLEGTAGSAHDALPLILRYPIEGTVAELLEASRQTLLDCWEHQAHWSGALVGSRFGGEPLSTVSLSHGPLHGPADGSLPSEIHVSSQREGDRIILSLAYEEAHLEAANAEAILEHLERALSLFDRPDRALASLEVLSEPDRLRLLETFGVSTHEHLPTRTLVSWFEDQVARHPEAIALEFLDRRMTYAALDREANRLAQHLRRSGVEPGQLVGLHGSPSERMILGILAILKAGGAYVPLDKQNPPARLAALAEASGMQVLVTGQDSPTDGWFHGRVVSLDGAAWASESPAPPSRPEAPSALAYVMFTSGSTGKPKGVAVEHRSAVRIARDTNYSTLGPGDHVLQLSNLAFDGSVFEIFGALLNGATLHIAPQEVRQSIPDLCQLIRSGINVAFVTTAVLHRIAELDPTVIGCLDRLYFGGQQASPRHVRLAATHQRRPGALVHMYGPTETTVFATYHPLLVPPAEDTPVPIGRPVGNTRVQVLDARGRLAPLGAAGEIVIGGCGVARGYWQEPELTARRFSADPFHPGGRVHWTGDLGRWLPDGTLEFVGRRDDLVKVRGYRIELGEVEQALRQCPDVEEAVVQALASGDEDRELVAYVQTSTSPPNVARLRETLRQLLPEYMVPARFLFVRFELNPNGKLDRSRLPSPDAAVEEESWVPPSTPTEARLAELWQELLGRTRIGAQDDFFEQGGHSLKAADLTARLRQQFNVEVKLRDVFSLPKLAELAAHIDTLAHPRVEPIPLAPEASEHPLSSAQARLWTLDQIAGAQGTVLHVPVVLELHGTLVPEELNRALTDLLERHEVLRTRFGVRNGTPFQRIVRPAPVSLTPIELSPGDTLEAELEHHIRKEGLAPFSLTSGLPFRASLLRCGPARHVLLLTLHHIAADGWSLGILLRDLTALYRHHALGVPLELPPLRIQYKDYVHWRRPELAPERAAAAQAWWSSKLSGAARLELPTDFPRPAVRTFAGGRREVPLGPGVRAALQEMARQTGATLFMAAVALVKVLLHRYTGERDLTLGIPWAGRDHTDLHELIGFFVNTLVLRDEIHGTETFPQLLSRVRQTMLETLEHKEYPFDRMVEALQVPRTTDHHPLFDVIVSMHDHHLPGLATGEREELVPGLVIERRLPLYDVSLFDLALGFIDNGEQLWLHVEYSTELFTHGRIDRLIGHLIRLAESLRAEPNRALGHLPMLSAAEESWLHEHSTGPASPWRAETLVDSILASGRRWPDAMAVQGPDGRFTYGELLARAHAVAERLRTGFGVARGDVVGMAVDRSHWAAVALLGIWQAGAAFLPLDLSAPPARTQDLMDRAKIRVVLGLGDMELPEGIQLVDVTAIPPVEGWSHPPSGFLPAPTDLAYVLFTTGSTGEPKGVLAEHRNITHWTLDQLSRLRLGPEDRVLQAFSTQFDPALFFLCLGLCAGARVVVAGMEDAHEPARLERLLAAEAITVLGTTPARLTSLGALPPSVRVIITGGESATGRQLAPYVRGRRYVNQYGPTEATCVTCYDTDALPDAPVAVPIGRPLTGVAVDLLDAYLEPVPVGVPGQLYASGEGVARGYLGQPAATAESFLDNPHRAGQRMYRTGDWGRWREDGRLEFLGRRDGQVKVRGYRVELQAIAEVLLRDPRIRQAVVLQDHESPGEELVAYLESAEELREAELRSHLRDQLPGYMIPARFVVLRRFPLTGVGKFDHRSVRQELALPQPVPQVEPEPADAVLEHVRRAFSEGLEQSVSADDDFFELAGNSLKALRLTSLLEQRLGVRVPMRHVFTHSTARRLADIVRELAVSVPTPILPAPSAPSHPLSHAQLRMWLADQGLPDRTRLNLCAILPWDEPVDVAALKQSFHELAERHEALRTCFSLVAGEPRQQVLATSPLHLDFVELTGQPDAEARTHALALQEAHRPFDLASGPLLRPTLVRLSPERHRLILTAHHIACDGWGMNVLLRELRALYEAHTAGRPAALPPLPIQYKDYAHWQHTQLAGAEGSRLRAYWHQRLSGALPRSSVPTDTPRPADGSWEGAVFGLDLDEPLSEGLRSLSTSRGTSLYMTLFAGVAALIHRLSGQTELLLGFPSSGREHPDLGSLVGFFINPLALRIRVAPERPFLDLLDEVKEACLGAYDHQGYPFDLLVSELGHRPPAGHAPLFDLGFTWAGFDGIPGQGRDKGPAPTQQLEEVLTTAKSDLWFHAAEQGSRIRVDIEYRTELFREATVRRHASALVELLKSAVSDPSKPLSQLASPAQAATQQPPPATRYSW